MRRMPELALIEPRLSDPDWHPTQQEIAEALSVVSRPRQDKQAMLTLEPPK